MVTFEQFGSRLIDSGLFDSDELANLTKAMPADLPRSSATDLAKYLIRAGRLTKFQAQTAFQGSLSRLVLGKYEIVDKLGEGGMGQVYQARHRVMDRQVALKILPPDSLDSAEAVRRFQREVKAAARLEHPNIVTAYDADEADGQHFLVMQFVDGEDLASIVRRYGPMMIEQAVNCCIQAAQGLAYAHGQGVVHRDVKPSNLLLDKNGTVKILDMGLARLDQKPGEDSALVGITHSGQVMGTVDYMAPEQAANTGIDHRADVYSLGCTLYVLLTAKAPFGGDTVVQKLMAHQQQPVPKLSDHRGDVPLHLDAVLAKTMAKSPDDRYANMDELIGALNQCLAPEQQHAPGALVGGSSDSNLTNFFSNLSGEPITGVDEVEVSDLAAYDQTVDIQRPLDDTARPPARRTQPQPTASPSVTARPTRHPRGKKNLNTQLILIGSVVGCMLIVVAVLALLLAVQVWRSAGPVADNEKPRVAENSDPQPAEPPDEPPPRPPIDEPPSHPPPPYPVPPGAADEFLQAKFVRSILPVHLNRMALSSDGSRVAISQPGGWIRVYETSNSKLVAEKEFKQNSGDWTLGFGAGDQKLVFNRGKEVIVADARTMEAVVHSGDNPGDVAAAALSPDGKWLTYVVNVPLASATKRNASFLYELGAAEREPLGGGAFNPYAEFRHDGWTAAPVGTGEILFALPGDPEQAWRLEVQAVVTAVGFAESGEKIAIGTDRGLLTLNEWETGQIIRRLPNLPDRALKFAFHPGGHLLAAGYFDWDAKYPGPIHVYDLTRLDSKPLVLASCESGIFAWHKSGTLITTTKRGLEEWAVDRIDAD